MSENLWQTASSYRGSPTPLEATLENEFSTTQLRELAKWLDVKLKGTSKSGYIEQVTAALKERSEIANGEAILEGLTDEQADFIRRLLTARDADLPVPRNVMMTVWAKQYGGDASRKLAEAIELLRRRAILFPTLNYYANSFRDVYFQWLPLGRNVPVLQWAVDEDAEAVEPSDKRRKTKTEVKEHGETYAARSPAPHNFLDGFETFLRAVISAGVVLRSPLPAHAKAKQTAWLQNWEHDAAEAERVMNSRPGWVPEPTTGMGVPMLSLFTPEGASLIETQTGVSLPQCELFCAIACALQLISPTPTDPKRAPGLVKANMLRVEEWFALGDADKMARVWHAWSEQMLEGVEVRNAIASLKANDTFQVFRAIGARTFTPNQMAAEWCALRRYMARVLRGLPVGVWVDWDTLRQQLFEFYPDCAWLTASRAEWWFGLMNRARLDPLRNEDWNNSIGRILERVVMDSLAWFGAVQTQVEDNRLQRFCVTDVGTWLIGNRATELPALARAKSQDVEAVEWTDAHTLRVPPAPNRAEFVQFVRAITERGTQPFTFAFTAASMESALAQGITLEQVLQQFKRAKLTLSKPLQTQFKHIAKRYGRVRVYDALNILEVADELALRELNANTSLATRVVYQISPKAVVLKADDLDTLIEEMQEKGYTPRVK